MATKTFSVFGIYTSRENAENAVDRLVAECFREEHISVLLKDTVDTRSFAFDRHTKAPDGATRGVVAGGVIGGALGLLAHIGVLAIPGVGPLIAAGPMIAALITGMGSGGMLGGIIGALVGIGLPEFEAKRYEGRIKAGGILVSVRCESEDWMAKAKEVLKQTGADDVSSYVEERDDLGRPDTPVARSTTAHQS